MHSTNLRRDCLRCSLCGKKYGESYGKGDVITIVYNPFKATLRFVKNGSDKGVINDIKSSKELSYRLCVSLSIGKSRGSIQLC